MDLLTTCTHHSELQVITAPLLISTIHRLPLHPLSLFLPLWNFNNRSLATASNNGDSSVSRAHVVTVRRICRNWALIDCQLNYSAISSQPPLQSSTQLNSVTHQPTTSLHFTQLNCSSQSQSYVTTDGQSASLSWNKAPIWGLRPDLYYCQTVAVLLMWGALSDERTGLSFAWVTVSSNKSVVSMYILHVIKCMYIQHIQGVCQSRLSTADHALSLVAWTAQLNCLQITPRRGPHWKHRSSSVVRVFTEPLFRNGLHYPVVLLLQACMLRALLNNGRCIQNHRLETVLYATLSNFVACSLSWHAILNNIKMDLREIWWRLD
jgi:hypothetical protein